MGFQSGVGMHKETQTIHAGEKEHQVEGAVTVPIFQAATYKYSSRQDLDYHQIRYLRLNNTPNHELLHKKLASLEGTEDALVTASGMAAITTTLLTFLKPGDHILVQEGCYGGTCDFVNGELKELGIDVTFFTSREKLEDLEKKITGKTKIIYAESISNPLLQITDLSGVAALAKKMKIMSVIDNTFPSPINFNPAKLGFDLVLHSATKYLNGHSDIVAGAIMGSKDLIKKIFYKLGHYGATLDPHAAFLLNRGLKTLCVRMDRHNDNALAVAKFLSTHPKVAEVIYPGLETHPQHKLAQKYFTGAGGMVSCVLKEASKAEDFIEHLEYFFSAPSLGGVESLVTRPATTSHRGISAKQRQEMGISDGLIRLSVGIEHREDLIEDLKQALQKI